jgi:hypothetical protein
VAPWGVRPEDCERMCTKRIELEMETLGDSVTSFEECVKQCMSTSA